MVHMKLSSASEGTKLQAIVAIFWCMFVKRIGNFASNVYQFFTVCTLCTWSFTHWLDDLF